MGRKNQRINQPDLTDFTSTKRRLVPELLKLSQQFRDAIYRGDKRQAAAIVQKARALKQRDS
ncbi:MAG: hypothetical protein HY975_00530 [Candidatus Kerfeldbacteria bacterium]|nr:hypothetical protein [Candidatus Kerfeldbacteria bacterium]